MCQLAEASLTGSMDPFMPIKPSEWMSLEFHSMVKMSSELNPIQRPDEDESQTNVDTIIQILIHNLIHKHSRAPTKLTPKLIHIHSHIHIHANETSKSHG